MFTTAIKDLVLQRPRLLKTFNGHTGPVICIAISPNGNLMASGGVDGLKVWDIQALKEVPLPEQPFAERAQVSALCWVTRKDETVDTLCFGNSLGYLYFLQHRPSESRFEKIHSGRIAKGGEILSIAANLATPGVVRLATGTRDQCVQVWDFNSQTRTLLPMQSTVREMVPKALAFANNVERDLYVFGVWDGGLYKYHGSNGNLIGRYQLRSQIGSAAVDDEGRMCVVDNAGNGFDMYRLETGNFVRSFLTGEPKKTFPRVVAFANRARAVIGGSDHGKVYIFERKTGEVVKILSHAKKGGVETIAVHDQDDATVIIASASSSLSGASPILLWKWKPAEESAALLGGDQKWTVTNFIWFIVKLAIVCAALAYIADHAGVQWQSLNFRNNVAHTPTMQHDLQEMIRQAMKAELSTAVNIAIKTEHTAAAVKQNTAEAKDVTIVAGREEAAIRVREQAAAEEAAPLNDQPHGGEQDLKPPPESIIVKFKGLEAEL